MLQQLDRIEGLQRVNDFVVKFANVNGSGSASANERCSRRLYLAHGRRPSDRPQHLPIEHSRPADLV